MDKRRPQLDSAHQIGLMSHPHESSDCSVDGLYGGQSCWGGIPKIRNGGMFSMAERQPVAVWTNGGPGWIQHVK